MTAPNGSGLVVDVFTDPSGPWTWITSRWHKEVAPQRNLELRWRSYSLEIRDGGELPSGMPEDVQRVLRQWAAESHRALRVFEHSVLTATRTRSMPSTPSGDAGRPSRWRRGDVVRPREAAAGPQQGCFSAACKPACLIRSCMGLLMTRPGM